MLYGYIGSRRVDAEVGDPKSHVRSRARVVPSLALSKKRDGRTCRDFGRPMPRSTSRRLSTHRSISDVEKKEYEKKRKKDYEGGINMRKGETSKR